MFVIRTCAHGHMIALGEHPGVEVGGDVISQVHLGEIFVVLHLLVRQSDPLLKCDGAGVITGLDRLRDPAIGAVGTDDDVDGEAPPRAVAGVVHDVRGGIRGGNLEIRDEAGDYARAGGLGAGPEEGVKDLPPDHCDELAWMEGFTEVHGEVRRRDDPHLGDMAVDEPEWDLELVEHAEGDRAPAGLGSSRVSFEEEGLDPSGG